MTDTVYNIVTEKIVGALEEGTVPWQQPWHGGQRPANLMTGKAYRGVNVILLHLATLEGNYRSPYWLTFRQAKELGGTVRKGEHGTVIVFWQMVKGKKAEPDEPNKMVPLLRYYRVFNLEQCDDVRIPKGREAGEIEPLDFDPIQEAETIIAGYHNPPKIVENEPRAFFRPDADLINLPPRASFTDEGEFYSTAFHEMTHSTGVEKRLNRHTGKDQFVFGSHDYGREELVAEMGSAFLCAEAGIESTFDNSAAYINGWMRTIKEDPRAVVVAAGAAQRAADYILGRTPDTGDES